MASMMLTACDEFLTNQGDNSDEKCEVCGEEPCVCEDKTCPDCGKNPCECATPNPEFTPLQPSEQKTKIASVGEQFLEKIPAQDWEKYAQILEDFANSAYTSEDYNWGSLAQWFEQHGEEIYKEEVTEEFKNSVITKSFDMEIVILMANHTGLFECTEKGVTIKDYNGGTKATFALNGKTYEFEISQEGKVTEAIYINDSYSENRGGDYYDDYGNLIAENVTQIYKDHEVLKIGVPEKLNITIKENSSYLMDVQAEFTASLSKDKVNLTTDSFTSKVTASINGFEITANKVGFDSATGKAESKISLKKNGEVLYTASSSAEVTMKEEVYEWKNEWYDEWQDRTYYDYYTYTYYSVIKAKDINMYMDILGAIQVKGSCSNAIEASEESEAMWDALSDYDWETGNSKTPDLNEANRHLDNFNAKFKINVYYDGTDTRQAAVKFALSSHTDDYSDYTYYDLIPILEFNDGSKYKIEEFFTENAFGSLVESFYALCESYAEVFGFSIEEEQPEYSENM